jgi:hypothetical protein
MFTQGVNFICGSPQSLMNIQAIPTPKLFDRRSAQDDGAGGPIVEEFDGLSAILGEDGTPIYTE